MSNISNDEYVEKKCKEAINYAKSFKTELDYSDRSINELEEILEYYYRDIKPGIFSGFFKKKEKNRPTANQIYSMATIWGIYIGETIRRRVGNNIFWEKGETFYLKAGEIKVFPIQKVYKRMKRGSSDSVSEFYDLMIIKLSN